MIADQAVSDEELQKIREDIVGCLQFQGDIEAKRLDLLVWTTLNVLHVRWLTCASNIHRHYAEVLREIAGDI